MSGPHFMSGYDIDSIKNHRIPLRLGICQILYTSEIKKNNFIREKRANRDIFGQKLRMEDVLLIYIEQIVSFCAIIYSNIIYSNTNSVILWKH